MHLQNYRFVWSDGVFCVIHGNHFAISHHITGKWRFGVVNPNVFLATFGTLAHIASNWRRHRFECSREFRLGRIRSDSPAAVSGVGMECRCPSGGLAADASRVHFGIHLVLGKCKSIAQYIAANLRGDPHSNSNAALLNGFCVCEWVFTRAQPCAFCANLVSNGFESISLANTPRNGIWRRSLTLTAHITVAAIRSALSIKCAPAILFVGFYFGSNVFACVCARSFIDFICISLYWRSQQNLFAITTTSHTPGKH